MRKIHNHLLMFLVLFLVSCLSATSVQTLCLDDQRSALELLHQGHSFSFNSWDPRTDCCSWEGITCDSNGHVIELDLSYRNLSISSSHLNSIVTLHHIQLLDLAGNNFGCIPIPSGIGRLLNLTHLRLSNSYFSGQIPLEISQLTRLVSLDLSQSDKYCASGLKLEKPNLKTLVQNLKSLKELNLDAVSIPGQTDWCEVISQNLSQLRVLSLSECGLTGPVCSLLTLRFLSTLNLGWNSLSSLPADFLESSPRLVSLSLVSCNLNAHFPERIFQLPKIRSINISDNPQLTIQFPEFPTNSSLQLLVLSGTNIGGNLPDSIANLRFLKTFYASTCNLFGAVPASIANITQLENLALAENSFSGSIPPFHRDGVPNLIYLNLYDNQLQGIVPSSILTLPSLVYLDLGKNHFVAVGNINEFQNTSSSFLEKLFLDDNPLTGQIPMSIFKFPRLRDLYIASKELGSLNLTMPYSLDNIEDLSLANVNFNDDNKSFTFSHLKRLALRSCNLTQLPKFITTHHSLTYLDLSDNLIHGLPRSICNLRNLIVFDASNNTFSSQIPDCLANISSLVDLLLDGNNFSGILPEFSQASKLRSLSVHGNKLEGKLPRSLANCKMLEVLDLGKNMIRDTFPFWLHELPFLKVLIIRANRFHGPIQFSNTKKAFPMLLILDLALNNFSGELPTELFQCLTAMMKVPQRGNKPKYIGDEDYTDRLTIVEKGMEMELIKIITVFTCLDLSNNSFSGMIPGEIKTLISLNVLNLSHNGFFGNIPSAIGDLTQLESLDLSQNKFSGKIPAELRNLNFLEVVNLSYNDLEGIIPQGNQFGTFSNSSFKGNSKLCGLPLTKKCQEPTGPELPPPKEDDEASWIHCLLDWKIVSMGYGCGLVIGFSVGYIVLEVNRNKWLSGLINKNKGRRNGRRRKRSPRT